MKVKTARSHRDVQQVQTAMFVKTMASLSEVKEDVAAYVKLVIVVIIVRLRILASIHLMANHA